MRISVSQIYIEVGATFPFSFSFNKWLGNALSDRVQVTEHFRNKYGAEFELGFCVSAKREIDQPEVRGPTVFKRDKDIEFTIFLPYRSRDYHDVAEASLLVEMLLQSAVHATQQIGLDAAKLIDDLPHVVSDFRSTPGLLNAREA